MDSFTLVADLLIGILLSLTTGLCITILLGDATDRETEEDVGFSPQATPRMTDHEAQTHPRPGWWQRIKNLITSSTWQSFTEMSTDYAAPFIPAGAEHYGVQALSAPAKKKHRKAKHKRARKKHKKAKQQKARKKILWFTT